MEDNLQKYYAKIVCKNHYETNNFVNQLLQLKKKIVHLIESTHLHITTTLKFLYPV